MRLKIIAGNIVALLIVGLGSYMYLKDQLHSDLGSSFEASVASDGTLFQRSWRLSAVEFIEQVSEQASRREVRTALRALDENGRRRAAHDRANSIAAWFQDPARGRVGRPDVVLITDETGRVVARDQDPNRMVGRSLMQAIPTLREVIAGTPQHDAWLREDDNKLLQVGMAPIRSEAGGVVGALVVAYEVSNGVADRESDVLDREVAFLRDGAVYSSSLPQGASGALQTALGGPQQDVVTQVEAGRTSSLFRVELNGQQYVGVAAPLPVMPSQSAAFVLLGDETAALAPLDALNTILILMGIGVVLVLVYGFLIGTSILRPMEQMEESILSIINGRTDTRIDIEDGEFGGLAYRVNQLINMFMGVEEADAEGHTAGGQWDGAERGGDSGAPPAAADDGSADDSELAAKLAAEPEADYQKRIFDEYVAAKKAVGEDVSNIPQDRFISRLEKNAANLVKKHGCRMVRFEVQTKGSQVILRPVIIR